MHCMALSTSPRDVCQAYNGCRQDDATQTIAHSHYLTSTFRLTFPPMTELPASDETPPTAVMFFGNWGVGKSTLLTLLGGNFTSGVKFMESVTRKASEQIVTLDGEKLILIDIPGLYENDEEASEANAKELTRALGKGYRYKLFFLLTGHNRGLQTQDLALMSNVNKHISQDHGAKVEFGIIVNQIKGDKMYDMYAENFTKDNLQKIFGSPEFKKLDLDIQVGSVTLLRFEEEDVLAQRVRDAIIQPVRDQVPVKICLSGPIVTQDKDKDRSDGGISRFRIAAGILSTLVVMGLGLALGQ
ncbi:MAG: hypothetical protein J3Q66DRAFT_359176 [Benniella sp.]|nr:MAG: hypothetical protein J3Q66DRAFT_359176 [Benniella sp.]